MKIDLSKQEMRTLLDIIFLGDWVLGAYDTLEDATPEKEKYKALVQKIYGIAKEAGFDDLIEYAPEINLFTETLEFEESDVQDYIAEFEENTFWEKLISSLAGRDALKALTPEKIKKMSDEERFTTMLKYEEKWAEEFDQYGLDRLDIKKK